MLNAKLKGTEKSNDLLNTLMVSFGHRNEFGYRASERAKDELDFGLNSLKQASFGAFDHLLQNQIQTFGFSAPTVLFGQTVFRRSDYWDSGLSSL